LLIIHHAKLKNNTPACLYDRIRLAYTFQATSFA
jgi:hypothetical protein